MFKNSDENIDSHVKKINCQTRKNIREEKKNIKNFVLRFFPDLYTNKDFRTFLISPSLSLYKTFYAITSFAAKH